MARWRRYVGVVRVARSVGVDDGDVLRDAVVMEDEVALEVVIVLDDVFLAYRPA